jgi:hypothetical protein
MLFIRKYHRFFAKSVFLAGCILLLAVQGNYRFYNVANFFDYQSNSVLSNLKAQSVSSIGKVTSCQKLADTHSNTHLGMDKRYAAKALFQLPVTGYLVVASSKAIQRKYRTLLKVFSSSHLPTNALRGPPCA